MKPTSEDLKRIIHPRRPREECGIFAGLDSLGYLNINNLVKATDIPEQDLCLACFDGKYPVPIDEEFTKYCLE